MQIPLWSERSRARDRHLASRQAADPRPYLTARGPAITKLRKPNTETPSSIRMIISHSRQFTFVHIHKAGGTSVEQALDPCLAWNDLILGGSSLGERIQVPYSARFGLHKHSAVSQIESVCGSRYTDEYYLFALVRHPLARVCSIYNFIATALNKWAELHNISLSEVGSRITPKAAKKTPALTWPTSRAFLTTGSFSEFIRHENVNSAPGFRSQVGMLTGAGGERPKGQIFRLEDYPHWASALGERLGVPFELPQANRSVLRLVVPESVSAEDRAFVERLFRADYEAFDYKP